MHKKMIGTILALAALLALGFALRAHYTQTSSYSPTTEAPGHGVVGNAKTDTDPFDVEIVYTNSGFSSTSVTVQKGTRIRFLNKSSKEEWPASGIHPTHTLYPEKEPTDCLGSSFDSCQSLKPGEYFDFTFNYVGTWPFHDHLHGYDSGQIIVR